MKFLLKIIVMSNRFYKMLVVIFILFHLKNKIYITQNFVL